MIEMVNKLAAFDMIIQITKNAYMIIKVIRKYGMEYLWKSIQIFLFFAILNAMTLAREAIAKPFPPMFTPYVMPSQQLLNFETNTLAGTLLIN